MFLSTRDTAVFIPAEDAVEWIREDVTGTYINLALCTIIVYDTLCTLDSEIRYFWRGAFGFTRLVFFLNRYGGIFGALVVFPMSLSYVTPKECLLSVWGRNIANVLVITSIDYVLMLRVLALCLENKTLTFVFAFLLASEVVLKAVVLTLGIISEHITAAGFGGGPVTVCAGADDPKQYTFYSDWIVPLGFGALLLVLALYKATIFWKEQGFHGSRLLHVLVRDQIVYYTLAIASAVFNLSDHWLGSTETGKVARVVLPALGSPILLCVFGSHMFFNLREAAEHNVNIGTNWASYQLADMHFEGEERDAEV